MKKLGILLLAILFSTVLVGQESKIKHNAMRLLEYNEKTTMYDIELRSEYMNSVFNWDASKSYFLHFSESGELVNLVRELKFLKKIKHPKGFDVDLYQGILTTDKSTHNVGIAISPYQIEVYITDKSIKYVFIYFSAEVRDNRI